MKWTILVIAMAAVELVAAPVSATFHLMQIERIIGGVDNDPAKQAIQLRMRANFQNQMQLSRLIVRDAAGANPVIIATPGSSVANASTGDLVLIATAAFNSTTVPAAVPDFTMINPIPASYLPAGSLTFEDAAGTVYWRVSWGGASYTGSNAGAITNDADGNFGPAYGGALPSSNTQGIVFQGIATALSTNNATDYAMSTNNVVFTNNAGESFVVQSMPTAVAGAAAGGWLEQNTPNPFNPSTTIAYVLPMKGRAVIRVYGPDGRLVRTLVDSAEEAGPHEVTWDGRDDHGRVVASGVYFYRLEAGRFRDSKKMVLLK